MIFSIAITGPTASGKTALSISLAEALSGELISCDSMQIYQGMDIGTAKATADEQARAKHHMIDFLSPLEGYSAEVYRTSAIECVRDVSARGHLPIFVGGTGLYIDSVSRGVSHSAPESDPAYRDEIMANIKSDEDITALWERLRAVDPESAEKIHKNNIKRVIRALEIYDKTGVPKSTLDKESKTEPGEVFVGMITLDFHDRELLYSRIDMRVDMMMDEGLLDEVKGLYDRGLLSGATASQAIGYKEIVDYIEGRCTLPEAIDNIKLASRRYAKRQLTWFRHEPSCETIFVDRPEGGMRDGEEILAEAIEIYEKYREKFTRENTDNEGI